MFSKLIRLSAVMATAVLASVSAAPVAEAASQQCASLGKGPLGFNASGIGIYSTNPPAVYVAIDDTTTNGDRLMASQKAKWEDQTMFEFFNCSYTPPPYFGKGSILTYQGYIKAPDGNCVSISALNTQGAYLSTVPCKFQDDSSMGGVDATQHFQFQLFSFDSFYSAVFLGNTAGPVEVDSFGAGGNYHVNLARRDDVGKDDTDLYVSVNYLAEEPQKGALDEMLIGQLGTQYVRPDKQFPACTLVKRGPVVLVNDKTGETLPVTIKDDNYNTGDNVPALNGTQSYNGFGFYQCDSEYMGYRSDEENYYGHLTLQKDEGKGYCFVRQAGVDGLEPYIFSTNAYDGECGTTDDAGQVRTFFHLAVTEEGYEISYLGGTAVNQTAAAKAKVKAASDVTTYGWTTERVVQQPRYDSNEVVLNPNPARNADVTNYKLRFDN